MLILLQHQNSRCFQTPHQGIIKHSWKQVELKSIFVAWLRGTKEVPVCAVNGVTDACLEAFSFKNTLLWILFDLVNYAQL